MAQVSLLSKGLAQRCNLQRCNLYPLEDLVRAITKSVCNAISQKDIMVGGNVAQGSWRYVRAEDGLKELKELLMLFQAERGQKTYDNETRDYTSRQRPVFIQGVWDNSENKGPEGRQRNKESGHACSLRTKGKIRGDNEKSLKGQRKEDH